MLKLITVKPDYTITINALEAVTHVAFNKILTRVNPSPGDPKGDKKLLNTKEMAFVVLYSEKFLADSTYAAQDLDDKVKMIRKDIGLESSWYPDEDVMAACNAYIDIQKKRNPTLSILNSLERGLMVSSEAVKAFNKSTSKAIKKLAELEEIEKHRKLDDEEQKLFIRANEVIVNNVTKIMEIGTKLPKTIAAIHELLDKVKVELSTKRIAKGGATVGKWEDPR